MHKNQITFSYRVVELRKDPVSIINRDRDQFRRYLRSTLRNASVSMIPLVLGTAGFYLTGYTDYHHQILIKPAVQLVSGRVVLAGMVNFYAEVRNVVFWGKKLREHLRTSTEDHIKEQLGIYNPRLISDIFK